MDDALLTAVQGRLEGAALPDDSALMVLAACEGQLDALLGGDEYTAPDVQSPEEAEPPGIYLGELQVEGFRGIGPSRCLPLEPGPGLTLVVGRNGSGKSSFAEAAELLVTGTNPRWADRPEAWQEGWRNLQHPSRCGIRAEVSIDGWPGPVRLERCWGPQDELDDAATVIRPAQQDAQPIDELGLDGALSAFRPFLSYNELGAMLQGKPSDMYDAMSTILGLEPLAAATKAMGDARRKRAGKLREADRALEPVLEELEASGDERAARCHAALSGQQWDLDAVEEVLLSDEFDAETGSQLAMLQALTSLEPVQLEQVERLVTELLAAQQAVASVIGTNTARSRSLADVLEAAQRVHDAHGEQECPVCGEGWLNDDWRLRTDAEIQRLRHEAKEADEAHHQLRDRIDAARWFVTSPPSSLLNAEALGIDSADALASMFRAPSERR